jgi:dipeptidyl aminopeptidase/acylaminoacyl peptidase
LWRAGINVAGVSGWANRGAGLYLNNFTIPRLGSPVDNPDEYDIATPYKHVNRINRPLMIMHGTNDANVAFHDSLVLIDHLLKAGKDFETVVYPGETHFFRRDYILRDAWRRVERFFDHHLKDK